MARHHTQYCRLHLVSPHHWDEVTRDTSITLDCLFFHPLLYNVAQIAGQRFNHANGEAEANTKVLGAMNDIQGKISSGTCASARDTWTCNLLSRSLLGP